MKANTISEEILGAIAAILNERSPDLLPIVKQLIEDNDAAPPSGAFGQSVHGLLTGSVPFLDGERILNVLEEYESIHGEQATVNGRQLNFIVLEWRRFSTPRDGMQPL
jgi:hypothetical protein